MEGDLLSRLVCPALNVRVYTAVTLRAVRDITSLHATSPLGSLLLGRAVTATTLLSATLKPESPQTIRFQISGDGPAGQIHVQADARGNIRGYLSKPGAGTDSPPDSISINAMVGKGTLAVTRDLGLKEPYTGVSTLQSGDIAMETARYLTYSEQVPSALILGMEFDQYASIVASGGILIQSFPDTPQEALAVIEHHIATMKQGLGESLTDGADIIQKAAELAGNHPLSLLSQTPLRAACRCSRYIIGEILTGIDENELETMLEQDRGIEISCAFCEKKYYFSEEEARRLVQRH